MKIDNKSVSINSVRSKKAQCLYNNIDDYIWNYIWISIVQLVRSVKYEIQFPIQDYLSGINRFKENI